MNSQLLKKLFTSQAYTIKTQNSNFNSPSRPILTSNNFNVLTEANVHNKNNNFSILESVTRLVSCASNQKVRTNDEVKPYEAKGTHKRPKSTLPGNVAPILLSSQISEYQNGLRAMNSPRVLTQDRLILNFRNEASCEKVRSLTPEPVKINLQES